jgi:hypothetical protein
MADRPANTSADALFFKPGILRSKKRSEPLREFTLDNASNNATSLTGSFRYDPALIVLRPRLKRLFPRSSTLIHSMDQDQK